MEENIEAFWANFEKETGEKVIARTMAQRFSTPKDRGDWGLLVLSPTGLRFRQTPGQNWFSSLFKASSACVSIDGNKDMFISFASMLLVEIPPRKILDFLFGTPFSSFDVHYEGPEGKSILRFAVDPKSDFLAMLKNMIDGQGLGRG